MNFEDLIAKVKTCGKQKLAVAAAAERAETYRVFEGCAIGELEDFEAVVATGDDAAFDEIE